MRPEGWEAWRNALGAQAAYKPPPQRFHHSFAQETLIGHLLCARTMPGTGDTGEGQARVLSQEEGRQSMGKRMSQKIPHTGRGDEELNEGAGGGQGWELL